MMLKTINNTHQQFAAYFKEPKLFPYLTLLSQKMSEGHICIPIDENLENEKKSVGNEEKTDYKNLLNSELVSINGVAYRPFVLFQNRLYMQRYFAYETQFLKRIKQIINYEKEHVAERKQLLRTHKKLIQSLFKDTKIASVDWQLVAALTAVLNNFTVITGGPGTGKTTTVAKILSILYTIDTQQRVALAAPTGKAAARIAESLSNTNIEIDHEIKVKLQKLIPTTLHRMLGWQKDSPYFRHNEFNPLPYDVIIVDESSMIDFSLFVKLLHAVPIGARILFLGDKDQLASVEAGSLFGDLCNSLDKVNCLPVARQEFINEFLLADLPILSGKEDGNKRNDFLNANIVALQHSFRFSGTDAIGKLSKAVILNDEVFLKEFIVYNKDTDVQVDEQYDGALFNSFIELYEPIFEQNETLNHSDAIIAAIQSFNRVRVLCAVRHGEQGLYELNKRIELFFQQKNKLNLNHQFYEHRPIMVSSNAYSLGLYNGDIGIIRKDENGLMKAWFLIADTDNSYKLKGVLPALIPNMETVFAMTIHKSQGSEFDNVLVVLPKENKKGMLTGALLYTAITRAKKRVLIQANAETILSASAAKVERGSGIIERLREIKA